MILPKTLEEYMSVTAKWNLPTKIIDLSEADMWSEAVCEWELQDVELLGPGEDSESCLCGHNPIRELCHIRNTKNGLTATVGNQCITKFSAKELAETEFEVVPLIIQACRRILKDPTASANKELIEYAGRVGVFTEVDKKFYLETWRKRKRTANQDAYKLSLNQKLLYQIILSKQVAFQRLKADPQGTAGPKLIAHAFSKEVIDRKGRDFYLQIWDLANNKLSDRQRDWKNALNKRIIQQFATEFTVAQ